MRFKRYLTVRAFDSTNEFLRLNSWVGFARGFATFAVTFVIVWSIDGFDKGVDGAMSAAVKALAIIALWPIVYAYYFLKLPGIIFREQRRKIMRLAAQTRPGPKPLVSPALEAFWQTAERLAGERIRELDGLPPWKAEFDEWKAGVTDLLQRAGYPHEAIGFKTTNAEARLIPNASKAQSVLLCELAAKQGKFRLIWMRIAEAEATLTAA